jgi:hypothetical protein
VYLEEEEEEDNNCSIIFHLYMLFTRSDEDRRREA